jgi:hypothetical protein
MGNADWHLDRNKHNKLPVGNLTLIKDTNLYKDQAENIWERLSHDKNIFHQPDHDVEMVDNAYSNIDVPPVMDPKNSNLKFLSKTPDGGSYEAILQPNGKYLTTGLKQGTYNYGHPSGMWGYIKHGILDVLPHFINANYTSFENGGQD